MRLMCIVRVMNGSKSMGLVDVYKSGLRWIWKKLSEFHLHSDLYGFELSYAKK